MPRQRGHRVNRGPKLVKRLEAALVEKFDLHGWKRGVPRTVGKKASRFDAAVCRCMHCPHCAAVGLDYRPFQRLEACRVLALCWVCGHAEEMPDMGYQANPKGRAAGGRLNPSHRVYRFLEGTEHLHAG